MLGEIDPEYFEPLYVDLSKIFYHPYNMYKIESIYPSVNDMLKDIYYIKNSLQNNTKINLDSNTEINTYYLTDFIELKSIGLGDYTEEYYKIVNHLIEIELMLDEIKDNHGIKEYNKRMSLIKLNDLYSTIDQIKIVSKEIMNVESKRRWSNFTQTLKRNNERFKDKFSKIYGYVRSLFRRS